MPENLRRGTVPIWLYAVAFLGLLALTIPLLGLASRVPFTRIPELMTASDARAALWLSLRTCLASTLLAVLLGVPTAVLLSRPWPGVRIARVIVLLPMALPPVVAGLALLQTFGRRGLIGAHLDALGIQIGFTTTAVIMAQTFVSMPFLIVALQSALQVRERGHEAIAATLGAGPSRILTRVTLPLVAPAIAQGTALALARSLGEFGATLTFAGSLTGVTRTMPLEIYLQRENDPEIALALAAVLILVAFCVVAITAWQQHTSASPRVRAEHAPADTTETDSARREADEPRASHQESTLVGHEPGVSAGGAPITAHLVNRERGVDVDLTAEAGDVLALVGRNGSGKSTCVQMLAGLLETSDSQVRIGERVLDDGTRHVPARSRGVALLAQRPLLLPHLSVLDNVAFGLRSRGQGRAEARERARTELAAVGCSHLANRRPHQLSGGQAARVSLARALATDPRVILLDEPMAALDVDAAADVRTLLSQRFRASRPTVVLVTHTLLDVATLASRVLVLQDGVPVEEGSADEILTRPRTEFSAALAGMNILLGRATRDEADTSLVTVCGEGLSLAGMADGVDEGADAVALFGPSAVALYPMTKAPEGSPRNVLDVSVTGIEQSGRLARVSLAAGQTTLQADITLGSVRSLSIAVGTPLKAVVKAAEVSVVARAGGRA
ncbi:MAG: ABC transporter permease [Bowdeniella nasicola]|nr:ABC transporter permease [Bowdeniella nasicola]